MNKIETNNARNALEAIDRPGALQGLAAIETGYFSECGGQLGHRAVYRDCHQVCLNSADPAFVVGSLLLSETEAGYKKEDSATIVITGNIPC